MIAVIANGLMFSGNIKQNIEDMQIGILNGTTAQERLRNTVKRDSTL